jgi:hypothetical protein
MINWHTDYRSRKLIEKLNRANVERIKRIAIPADYYVYVPRGIAARRTFKALENRRLRAVERETGVHFEDLKTSEACREYLTIDDKAPSVDEVIEAAFDGRELGA